MSEVPHEHQPHWPTVDTEELQNAAQQGIGATLHTGRPEVEVPVYSAAGAFTDRPLPATGGREYLTHILQAGDTLLGIASRKNPSAGYGKQDELRVYALPFGANADMPTAKLVSEGPLAKIGRPDMLGKGLANDTKMSKDHAEVALVEQHQSLMLKIKDAQSSNGTQLWSAGALSHPHAPESLRSVAQSLEDTRMWPAEVGDTIGQLPSGSGDHDVQGRELHYNPVPRRNMDKLAHGETIVFGKERTEQSEGPGLVAILQMPKSDSSAEDLYVIDVASLPSEGDAGKTYEGRRLHSDTQYVVVNPRLVDFDKGTGMQEVGGSRKLASANHFSLYVDGDGEKLIFKEHSSNGTRILAGKNAEEYLAVREARSSVDNILTDYTVAALEREPKGYSRREDLYEGNTPIDRSTTYFERVVDVRAGVQEHIAVDSSVPETHKAYEDLKKKFIDVYNDVTQAHGARGTSEELALAAAFTTVKDAMAYDLEYVKEKVSTLGSAHTDKLTNLGEYLSDGKGVCRHMALAVAWLGTEMGAKSEQQGEGPSMFPGVMTTQANRIEGGLAGHQWVRYESTDKKIYIIDPAQQFVGTLEAATNRGHGWEYRTEEERRAARGGALFSYVK